MAPIETGVGHAAWPIIVTDGGIHIDLRDAHPRKAAFPRIETLLTRSNVTLERVWHSAKQELQIFSIDEGIQID
jgi:hypothetical protein